MTHGLGVGRGDVLPPPVPGRLDPSAMAAQGLSKSYGSIRALVDVSLDLPAGSVLALLGENGAGKSTFVSLMSGAAQPDQGQVLVAGEPVHMSSPRDGIRAGIQVVHQEPKLINEFSIAENLFLSEIAELSPLRGRRTASLASRAEEMLHRLGLRSNLPDVHTLAGRLIAPERQIVAIAKAMTGDPRVLFLDEPNSSLTTTETERLWRVARELRSRGVALVVVSHRLTELYQLVDRVAVLRDGHLVGSGSTEELPISRALALMAGDHHRAKKSPERADPGAGKAKTGGSAGHREVLGVSNLRTDKVGPATFHVNAGEVVGLAGLVGAGRTEIGLALSGADRIRSGRVLLDGKPVSFSSPRSAMRVGVVMTSEERKLVILSGQTVLDNLTIGTLDRTSRFGLVNKRAERRLAAEWIERLSIRGRAMSPITALSGGNQQKVLLARALSTKPRVLILDEPTHGVDVATRAEIYELVRRLANDGLAVILISSDTEELVAHSDRIVVVRDRKVVQELDGGSAAISVVSAALGKQADLALVAEPVE